MDAAVLAGAAADPAQAYNANPAQLPRHESDHAADAVGRSAQRSPGEATVLAIRAGQIAPQDVIEAEGYDARRRSSAGRMERDAGASRHPARQFDYGTRARRDYARGTAACWRRPTEQPSAAEAA